MKRWELAVGISIAILIWLCVHIVVTKNDPHYLPIFALPYVMLLLMAWYFNRGGKDDG